MSLDVEQTRQVFLKQQELETGIHRKNMSVQNNITEKVSAI